MLLHLLHRSGPSVRWGATTAQTDLGRCPDLLGSQSEPRAVILDFDGIEAVNQSYVRQTAAWLVHCGIAARTQKNDSPWEQSSDPWGIRPLGLTAVFVANLTIEVRDDIDIFFQNIKLPCMEAKKWTTLEVESAQIIGHLDPQLFRTLECLHATGGEAVAETLWVKFPQDRIGITAWNNRLSELYLRHLVNRKKQGKYWRYTTLCREVSYGNTVHAS